MNPALAQEDVNNPVDNIWVANRGRTSAGRRRMWDSLRAAAFNFKIALDDIQETNMAAANPWRDRTREYVKYYYAGLQTVYNSWAATSGPAPAESAQEKASTALGQLQGKITEVFGQVPTHNIPATVPNHDLVELVIQAKFLSTPEDQRPTDLGTVFPPLPWHSIRTNQHLPATLQAFLRGLQLFIQNPARRQNADGSDDNTYYNDEMLRIGLPKIIFICLGHEPNGLRLGCTSAQWQPFMKVVSACKEWREQRFFVPYSASRIESSGVWLKNRFEGLKINGNIPRLQQRALLTHSNNLAGSLRDYNEVIEELLTSISQSGNFAFDHSLEIAGSFYGSGRKVFQPLSRCWKCRFLHQYNVNSQANDDPFTVAFEAYAGLGCAEDLCHFYCSLPLAHDAPPWPADVVDSDGPALVTPANKLHIRVFGTEADPPPVG